MILEVNDDMKLRGARVYGFKNIQNLIRKIKSKKCKYEYVEIMACPSGCLNGGGQILYEKVKPKIVFNELNETFHNKEKVKEMFFENEFLLKTLGNIVGGVDEFFGWDDVEYKVKEIEGISNPAAIKW